MNDIVSADWLLKNIEDDRIIILDASIKKVVGNSNENVENKYIPKSRFFDLKKSFSDPKSSFPNTVPSPDQFEKESKKLGINNDSKIIIYDNQGIYSSPSVWWLFKIMGHDDVQVLDGGLPEWINNEFPIIEKQEQDFQMGNFTSDFQGSLVKSFNDILNNTKESSFTIVDARSSGRFIGTEKEPRAWLKSGHIPHAVNIPYQDVLENGKFKSNQDLKELFKEKLPENDDLVFSCGSGLTACIILLAEEISRGSKKQVYDGSWTEWAELNDLKV